MEFIELSKLTEQEMVLELRRWKLLHELALSEDDLAEMGKDQRALVEDIITKVVKVRQEHAWAHHLQFENFMKSSLRMGPGAYTAPAFPTLCMKARNHEL